MAERTEFFQMRVTPEEQALLKRVAQQLNMSIADMIRQLVIAGARELDRGRPENFVRLTNSTAVFYADSYEAMADKPIGGLPGLFGIGDREEDTG